jgi:membrane associated rhomboid family serine protease
MFGRLTPVVKNLLLINVVIFVIQQLLSSEAIIYIFGLNNIKSDYFYPFPYNTYMFLHGTFMHLFFNMFAIFIFGPILEGYWGPKRFLIFYMVAGIGSGLLYSGIEYFDYKNTVDAYDNFNANPDARSYVDFYESIYNLDNKQEAQLMQEYENASGNPTMVGRLKNETREVLMRIKNIPTVGASGAIFGILAAFALLFPNTQLMLLFPPIPIKAKYFVLIYAGIELFQGIQRAPGDNVAHYAHLAGALVGFILVKYWQSKNPGTY